MELKIKKETAKEIYTESPDYMKKILEDTFGKECFEKKTFDEILTFEDACVSLEIYSDTVFSDQDTTDEIAYKKLKIISKAINQGWTPDWNNNNQKKWFPYFNLSSGFGFSSAGYSCDSTFTTVGSRLCTDTREKALYVGEQFKAEYQDYFLYSE